MIKFLIYLFIIYIIYKLIFGKALASSFKTKIYKFDTSTSQKDNNKEQEGSITIDPRIKSEAKSKNIGEYIDYEEIKDK